MTNPFLQYGDSFFTPRQIRRRSHVVQSEKEAPKVLRGAEKAMAEDSEQLRRFNRFHRADVATLQANKPAEIHQLIAILRCLSPQSSPDLLDFMEGHGWFSHFDAHARAIILRMIDDAIVRMRLREGLAPIDDSLPGEPPTVFEICRSKLTDKDE